MLPKELSYHRRFGGGQLGSHLTKCGVTLGKKLVSQQLDAVETSGRLMVALVERCKACLNRSGVHRAHQFANVL
jgi:hypothetical protein